MSIRRLKARGIGRLELLAWINELLETDYTKIEHLADGIAYCQLLDALHPGKVLLQQVQFHAKSHADYERNFRVLRRAFQACDIHKEIPMRKLVDGVFQEHFEFLHWLHDYTHKTYPDAVRQYDGFARRQQVLQAGGHASMSLRELDNANMNLVPSYAASSKGSSDGFLRSGRLALALDIIPVDVPDDLTLDDLLGDGFDPAPSKIPEHEKIINDTDTQEQVTDPLLRFVEHSYESTLQADRVLFQLEKTMAIVFATSGPVAPPSTKAQPQTNGVQRKSKQPKATTKTRKVMEDTSATDPPFLTPQLDELIKLLANELAGRAQDLQTLEHDAVKRVEGLLNPSLPGADEPSTN